GRRIGEDDVELAPLPREAGERLEDVAGDQLVRREARRVQLHVAPRLREVAAGEVDGDDLRRARGGGHSAEGAGVREEVEEAASADEPRELHARLAQVREESGLAGIGELHEAVR